MFKFLHLCIFHSKFQPQQSTTKEPSPDSIRRKRDRDSHSIRDYANNKGYSSDSLIHAAMATFKELGYSNAGRVMQRLLDDPTVGDSIMDLIDNPAPDPVQKLEPMAAVSVMLHHDQTKHDMESWKKVSKSCNADFLPNHMYISQARKLCRPPRELYSINETESIIPLKPLVVHTIQRIFEIPRVRNRILELKEKENITGVTLTMKGGSDT